MRRRVIFSWSTIHQPNPQLEWSCLDSRSLNLLISACFWKTEYYFNAGESWQQGGRAETGRDSYVAAHRNTTYAEARTLTPRSSGAELPLTNCWFCFVRDRYYEWECGSVWCGKGKRMTVDKTKLCCKVLEQDLSFFWVGWPKDPGRSRYSQACHLTQISAG